MWEYDRVDGSNDLCEHVICHHRYFLGINFGFQQNATSFNAVAIDSAKEND